MLVLRLVPNTDPAAEEVVLTTPAGEEIVIALYSVHPGSARLGVIAPQSVTVRRRPLLVAKHRARKKKTTKKR